MIDYELNKYEMLEEIASKIELPKKFLELSKQLLNNFNESKENKKKMNNKNLMIAIIYVACSKLGNTKNIEEIDKSKDINKNKINKYIKKLMNDLKIVQLITPELLVIKYANQINLDFAIFEFLKEITIVNLFFFFLTDKN